MALIQTCQKCEAFLSKFKEEICRNPNADVTPYTQMLAAEFRKWNKAHEKELINTLFLNLYARDGASLRRDLCKLEPRRVLCKLKALDTAKDRFPRRGLLMGYLDHVLYLRIGEDFSWIIAGSDRAIELERKKYEIDRRKYEIEQILSKFKEEICRNPNADFTLYIERLLDEYDGIKAACVERVIGTLLLNLYGQDVSSLKRDQIKLQVMVYSVKKTAIDLTPNQRTELLPSLYGALASYIGEDFSAIIAACDKIEAFEMKQ